MRTYSEYTYKDIIEIVTEAFYNITDKYPLDVVFKLNTLDSLYKNSEYVKYVKIDMYVKCSKLGPTFRPKLLIDNTNNQYDFMNDMIKSSNIYADVLEKSKISINYLRDDFTLDNFTYNNNSAIETWSVNSFLGVSIYLELNKEITPF